MSNHLKSYAVPKSWILLKKVNKWTVRPLPGPHPFELSMPVSLLLRQLGLAKTSREIKNIINSGKVFVDGKIIRDCHRAIGFMDVVHILDLFMRGSLDHKGRLIFKNCSADESQKKVCKIVGKKTVKNNKIQLSLLDGRTILVGKDNFAVGDSVVLEVPVQKILEHLPLSKGCSVFLVGGRHKGAIMEVESTEGNNVRCISGKDHIDTLKEFVVVVGKNKPVVTLSGSPKVSL